MPKLIHRIDPRACFCLSSCFLKATADFWVKILSFRCKKMVFSCHGGGRAGGWGPGGGGKIFLCLQNNLRWLNHPRLKFWLKEWSNHHLITIFDPNLSSESELSIQNRLKYVQFHLTFSKFLVFYSKAFEFESKMTKYLNFSIDFGFFDWIWPFWIF